MLTKKDFCDYETSSALEELGFPLKRMKVKNFIDGELHDSIVTVLLYEAQKWLRETKNIEVNASFDKMEDGWIAFIQRLDYPDLCGTDVFSTVYNTYESALSESIKEAIKVLNDKKQEYRNKLELENTEFDYGHDVSNEQKDYEET